MSIVSRVLPLLLALVAFGAAAQLPDKTEAEIQAAVEAAQKVQTTGPADVKLRDLATLKLPAGKVYVPVPEAARLMRSMGNTVDASLIGVVFPESDKENWMVVIEYVQEGHIKDDDAKDWNADDLLKSLKEGTEAGNAERTKRGFPGIEVTGWAEKPAYDAATHRLVWSAASRRIGDPDRGAGVNYNTYALGREGYISLNLITSLKELPEQKQEALTLLAALQYESGKAYTDFNASTDKVAAYGLAALVAGAAAKKLGLLAVVLAFLAKFAKVAIVAAGGLLWGVAKLFGKKKPEPEPPPESEPPTFADTRPLDPPAPPKA